VEHLKGCDPHPSYEPTSRNFHQRIYEMKKIVLSLAGVMAAVAFAPEASALPVFARQTGMACSACHFQHFPLLNAFGRSFKASGFTMMGAQGKVEGEEQPHDQVGKEGQIKGNGHSELSIPNVLNMGILTTTRYDQVKGSAAHWNVPSAGGELSLFFGGRVAEFAGFLSEVGLASPAGVGAAKLALLFPVGDARVGAVIHTSGNAVAGGGQGVAYSYELLNTGAANTHKVAAYNGSAGNHVKVTSAAQYFGTNTAATGISLVAQNDMGYVVLGRYEQAGTAAAGGAHNLPLTYARLVGQFDVAGFEAAVGLQNWSGSSNVTLVANKATVIDAQMQGEVAGMPLGVYASYGTAGATAAGANVNTFNAGAQKASSFNLTGELGVIPHVATVQLATRSAKNGAGLADNAIMVGGTYELAQNIELSLTHTTNSGAAWAAALTGKTETTLMLEALF
jgi:hypothetical protein